MSCELVDYIERIVTAYRAICTNLCSTAAPCASPVDVSTLCGDGGTGLLRTIYDTVVALVDTGHADCPILSETDPRPAFPECMTAEFLEEMAVWLEGIAAECAFGVQVSFEWHDLTGSFPHPTVRIYPGYVTYPTYEMPADEYRSGRFCIQPGAVFPPTFPMQIGCYAGLIETVPFLAGASGGRGGGGQGGDGGIPLLDSGPPQPGIECLVGRTGNGRDGTVNSGGGGGGGSGGSKGGAGGSGIVVVRYAGTARATGGTITSVDGYTLHTFIAVGSTTLEWDGTAALTADVLVVGGGGAGGGSTVLLLGGGGGGSGGVIIGTVSFPAAPVSYPVIVGAGGLDTGGGSSPGGDSVFNDLTALGGGAGGSPAYAAGSGGSGGGGATADIVTPVSGGDGEDGQGYGGGTGVADATRYGAGGGGGAGTSGGDGTSTGGGVGGDGRYCPFLDVYFGGGGGGGTAYLSDTPDYTVATGTLRVRYRHPSGMISSLSYAISTQPTWVYVEGVREQTYHPDPLTVHGVALVVIDSGEDGYTVAVGAFPVDTGA